MEYASVIIVAVLGLLGNVIASALNSNKQTAVMQAEIKGSNALIDQKIGEVKADIRLAKRVQQSAHRRHRRRNGRGCR